MKRSLASVFALVSLLAFSMLQGGFAQLGQSSLTVEWEQHWDTYMVGGTCTYATHNIHLADIDGDGETEIATGGYTYSFENNTRVNPSAPLKIWSWDGQSLTLETSYKWPEAAGSASITCVTSGDLNRDSVVSLLTGGAMTNTSGNYAQLRIWLWDGVNLTLKTSKEWNNTKGTSSVSAVVVADADADGQMEIFSGGRARNAENNQTDAQLCVWRLNRTINELTLLKSTEWHEGEAASVISLCTADLDDDGGTEIVTAGYNHELANSSGQSRIWQWRGGELSLEANHEWRTVENAYALTSAGGVQGNTVVNNVKAGDVDGDGVPEIVTGGFTYDGEKVRGQLCIWNWTGQEIALETGSTWTSEAITEAKAITLNDVDGDGGVDIVASGVTASQNSFTENATVKEMAQLNVWTWNGSALVLKESTEWTVGDGVCAWNVASGDVDKDGTVEIVTVGCMYVTNMCDPDMRIWSIAESEPSPTAPPTSQPTSRDWQTELILAAVGSVAVIGLAAGYLFMKKRTQKGS